MLELFRPNQVASEVTALDLAALWGRGIRGIVLDMDNTLCAWEWNHPVVAPAVKEWVARAKQAGFSLCIISNGRPARVASVSSELGIAAVAQAGKPRGNGYRRALVLLGTTPGSSAMVGDQLLTDIFGGNRAGFYTVLVPALAEREFIVTKFNRLVERCISRRLGLVLPTSAGLKTRCRK